MSRQPRQLPDFPWDSLAGAARRAREHPDGLVDLSVGTPVDDVAEVVQRALCSVSEVPGYPATWGTSELRGAVAAAMDRRYGVPNLDPDAVLPTIGSKEFIAWLPTLLGLGAADTVVVPELAYPTYAVGAKLAGAQVVRSDDPSALAAAPALIFLNSPSNPTGAVLPAEQLRAVVQWAREHGVIVVSDECYLGLAWEAEPLSVLHPTVNGGSLDGLLAVHSLSKTSSLAGYRAGFVTGDPTLVAELLEVRKHAGMMVSRPVQAAMTAALTDDAHATVQRGRYQARRARLLPAVTAAGFRVEHFEAGLYLWATRGQGCRDTVAWFAEQGILVAPGEFYGPAGSRHVRIALTATDERIDAAVARLET
ncbi:MAG: succinyldiaminopimelate transaminase [Mycobacteriaceae bacterium]